MPTLRRRRATRPKQKTIAAKAKGKKKTTATAKPRPATAKPRNNVATAKPISNKAVIKKLKAELESLRKQNARQRIAPSLRKGPSSPDKPSRHGKRVPQRRGVGYMSNTREVRKRTRKT